MSGDSIWDALLGSDDEHPGNEIKTDLAIKDDLLESTVNCQYTSFAGGYRPITKTLSKLPPGAYRGNIIQDQLIYKPVKLYTDQLIEFPDTVVSRVLAEIELFWSKKEKFDQLGFSHKRGIMLAGPPAGGKSSCVSLVIKKMVNNNGLVFIADHPGMLSMMLQEIRVVEPERRITVIWEDLDAAIKRYGESEVLAVLDGESQVKNIMFVATTNFPEDLEERITNRPSRFDRIEIVGMPSAETRKIYLTAKIGVTEVDGIDLVEATEGLSIAHLRELIVGVFCLDMKAEDVIERLRGMAKAPSSNKWKSKKTGFGV